MQRENKEEIFPHWLYQIYTERAWICVEVYRYIIWLYPELLIFDHPIKLPPLWCFSFLFWVQRVGQMLLFYHGFFTHLFTVILSLFQYCNIIKWYFFFFLDSFFHGRFMYIINFGFLLILKEWIHSTLSLEVCFVFGALKQKLVKAEGGFKFKCEFIAVLKIPQRRFMSCLDEQHICIKTKKQSYELWVLILAIF